MRSFRPHSRGGGRGSMDGQGTQRGSRRRHCNSQPKQENRTMRPRTSRGARSASAASYSPSGTQDQGKRPDRSPASRDTARPRHASLPVQLKREQDAFRPGDGAPARPPTSSPSRTRAGWPNPAAWNGVIVERKLTFSSPAAIAKFSKFAGILSTAFLQHHLLGFEIAQLEFCHLQ